LKKWNQWEQKKLAVDLGKNCWLDKKKDLVYRASKNFLAVLFKNKYPDKRF